MTNIAKATATELANPVTSQATVCFGVPPAPAMTMAKTPDKTVISPNGESVTYTYTVTNTGGDTINNITVVDDNGTPGNTTDDFTVGTRASLEPNTSATLTKTLTLTMPLQPITLCQTINGQSVIVGLLYTEVLPSGDIRVKYVQQNVVS